MHILRLTGFTLALVASIVVFLVLGPDEAARFRPLAVEGSAALIDQAIADYQSNSTNAGEDLELQAVTNGWIARDLLYVLANQAEAISEQLSVLSAQTDAVASGTRADDRVPALLLIGVITLAFHAATLPFVGPAPVAVAATRRRQTLTRTGNERRDADTGGRDRDEPDDNPDDDPDEVDPDES